MANVEKKHSKGIVLKTNDAIWFKEVIGLAVARTKALNLTKQIFTNAYIRSVELCGNYNYIHVE